MSVTILIPTALRPYADGQSEVLVEAATAGEALNQLAARHGQLKKHLYNDQGTLRSFINVFVRDEDIRYLNGPETALSEGELITIVPSIAGGAPAAVAEPDTLPELDRDELARYSRHLILPEVGLEGQRRLKQARVLLVGTGGLGAPLGLYLAAAGIGHLGLVDFDNVDASNLQRQVIHGTRDVGRAKIASAKERLNDLNPHVAIETFETRLTSENALDIIKDYDVVVDGTDNFPTRYLVNDACVLLGKPNVYGSIFRFEGQASVFSTKDGPCYRCLYPEPPPPGLVPSCAEGGVLGVLPGIIGSIQANETLKLILGGGTPLINRLLLFDAWNLKFKELKIRKDPNCPICGEHRSIHELIDYEQFCGLKNPAPALDGPEEITALELKRRIDQGQDVRILDVREPFEAELARIPNTTLIPLSQVAGRLGELDATRELVVMCKIGGRSAKAIQALKAAGYTGRLTNLKGGITAWSADVDPSVPRY